MKLQASTDSLVPNNLQSISGRPLIKSSSSLSLKIEIKSLFTSSLKPSRKAFIWGRMAVVSLCSAFRSTYSCLFSSVTRTFLPPGTSSTSVTCQSKTFNKPLQAEVQYRNQLPIKHPIPQSFHRVYAFLHLHLH